jgi:hypothetical protein
MRRERKSFHRNLKTGMKFYCNYNKVSLLDVIAKTDDSGGDLGASARVNRLNWLPL